MTPTSVFDLGRMRHLELLALLLLTKPGRDNDIMATAAAGFSKERLIAAILGP